MQTEAKVRKSDSFARRLSLAIQVFRGSFIFGRKGTVIWDSYEMWLMEIFLLPPTQMAFFALLARYLGYSSAVTQFIVVGNALQVMSFAAVFSVANITSQDKWQGTLQNLIVTPANRMALFIGRASFQVLMSAMIVGVGLVYTNILFGVSYANANLIGIALVILVTSASMISFGLLISSIGLFMRTAMIVANIFLFLTLLLSGVNFPVTQLPSWLQPLSWAIPMTYGTTAIRMAISGSTLLQLFPILAEEISDGAAVLIVGYLLLIGFESIARRTGRLEEY